MEIFVSMILPVLIGLVTVAALIGGCSFICLALLWPIDDQPVGKAPRVLAILLCIIWWYYLCSFSAELIRNV